MKNMGCHCLFCMLKKVFNKYYFLLSLSFCLFDEKKRKKKMKTSFMVKKGSWNARVILMLCL